METKIVVLATILCTMLVLSQVSAAPLEDQLPDTTGLFFGKRNHPNMNNLLFGRRSNEYDARRMCKYVESVCSRWGVNDE